VLTPAVARAHALGLRVAAHALCTEGVRIAARSGVDTIEHGWTITGRRQDFEPSVVTEVKASGAFGSVTTHDSLRDLVPSSGASGDVEELRRRLVPHRALGDVGVPMVVHSDAGPGPTRFDDFAASIRCYAFGMEVTAVEAIRAATGTAAAALGLVGAIGTVEPGAVADLVLVDGDPTVDLPTRERVRRVILGGRTVAIGGRLSLS
jgi:imidazolonepropionase-like amidohydrolase